MNLPKLENSLLSDLRRASLTLVAHDAGGANVLEAFVRRHNLSTNQHKLSGPAVEILGRLPEATGNSEEKSREIVLASTGWQTNFERKIISQALQQEIRTVVLLDHWTNFDKRLPMEDEKIYVKEIVTFDFKAFEIANKVFQNATVFIFPNYYLNEQIAQICKYREKNSEFKFDYLFIGEPIRIGGYTEFEALKNSIQKISTINSRAKLAIRPHPSQSLNSYRNMIASISEIDIALTVGTTLAEDLSQSRAAVGCNSMALEIASRSSIPTYCAVPNPFKSELPSDTFTGWESNEE